MTRLPRVSVVVPAHNAEAYLERAVRSIYATRYPDLQVLVVDDGSDDGTAAVMKRLQAEFGESFVVARHADGSKHGVAASRNLGITSSDGEWIAFLDADDFYLPHRFAAFERLLESGGAGDGVYEISEVRWEEPAPAAGVVAPFKEGAVFGIQRKLTGAALLEELLQGRCWATSAITLRRELLRKTGLFDVGKRIAEDCDLWFRVASAGELVGGDLENPVSVYWRHAGNTYEYDLRHRLAMLRAMFDSRHWVLAHAADRAAVMTAGVRNYLLRSMVALREAGRPDLAWQAWRLFLGADTAGAVAYPGVLRQAAASARERLFRRLHPDARSLHGS